MMMIISSMHLLSATALFILLLIRHFIRKCGPSDHQNLLPPGPAMLPLIGHLHLLDELPHRAFQKLSAKHGSLMHLQLGSIPTLVVSSSEMARDIFKNHDLAFSGRPVLYAAKRLTYNCSTLSFAPYGDYWRHMRKIVMLELLSSRRVQAFRAVRSQELKLFLNSIDASASASASSPVNLSELTLLLSNKIVTKIAFGKKMYEDDKKASKFHDMLRETQELLGGFCVADFFPWLEWLNKFNGVDRRIQKNLRELDDFFNTVINGHRDSIGYNNKHEAEDEGEDLVDVLVRLQKDLNQPTSITDDQIKGVLMDIFVAGTDTSSATLVWTMAELIKNPDSMKKAQEEVREVSKGKQMVEEEDLGGLGYLKAVVKEALRLHPPAPLLVPRETREICKIKGFEIPAKTRVFVNAKSIGMDPKEWQNPEDFKPERFLESSSVDCGYEGQQFEMLPFGVGRRKCPGINFAMPIVELVLANLLHRYDWKLPSGMKSEDLDMEEAMGITTHKNSHLCLIPHPVD